ncbi:MAG TPA: hypothetical protein V6D48_06075 [Oculatellaceae cyanobacterium]
MLFQADIETINAEIAQLQELIAAKQKRMSELQSLQNIADEAVKSLSEVVGQISNPDALLTLQTAVVGLFDGIAHTNHPAFTSTAVAPVVATTIEAITALVETIPTDATSVADNGSKSTPSTTESELAAVEPTAPEPVTIKPESELIQVTDTVSLIQETDGTISCTYVGFNNKSKAQSWGEWLTSKVASSESCAAGIALKFEVVPATKLPFKYELLVWGLNLNQVTKLSEQDFSKTPKAGFGASLCEDQGDIPEVHLEPAVTEPESNQSTSEEVSSTTTGKSLNGKVTGNVENSTMVSADACEPEATQAAAAPTKVAPKLEDLEPNDIVGSLLVPAWTYKVLEVKPNGQLNGERLLTSGQSFQVGLDISSVYLIEKAPKEAPEPEPEPLAEAPIDTANNQSKPQSESPEEEPTAAQQEEPMTPEKLALAIRAAWSWEEIEAVTAGNEHYKKAAWSLLTTKEKDRVLALKLQAQQEAKPIAEPSSPSAQPTVDPELTTDELDK